MQDKQSTQCQLVPKSKWRTLFILLKLPQSECPDIWIRLPRHKWPKSWSSIEEAVVPLERNLCGHLLAGLVVGKTIRGRSAGNWMGKNLTIGNASSCIESNLSIFVHDMKNGWKKLNLSPMWKN